MFSTHKENFAHKCKVLFNELIVGSAELGCPSRKSLMNALINIKYYTTFD